MIKNLYKILNVLANHNWLYIIYFNFKMLPFKQAIHLPFDFYHKVKFESLKGKVVLNTDRLYRGMIKIGSAGSEMFPHQSTILKIDGDLVFNGPCVIGINSTCCCQPNGIIHFGSNVIIGARNLVFCKKRIEFGNDFSSSWNCQFMDTDTHPIYDQNSEVVNPDAPVILGSHIWLGNNVTINKGTCLPSNTIIASHSLCNKDYTKEGQGVLFAGIPAKAIRRDVTWTL